MFARFGLILNGPDIWSGLSQRVPRVTSGYEIKTGHSLVATRLDRPEASRFHTNKLPLTILDGHTRFLPL